MVGNAIAAPEAIDPLLAASKLWVAKLQANCTALAVNSAALTAEHEVVKRTGRQCNTEKRQRENRGPLVA